MIEPGCGDCEREAAMAEAAGRASIAVAEDAILAWRLGRASIGSVLGYLDFAGREAARVRAGGWAFLDWVDPL